MHMYVLSSAVSQTHSSTLVFIRLFREIIYKAPGVATMGIKFFIAIAQMLLPFVLVLLLASTAAGLTSYNRLFYGCGIIYLVLFVLVFLFPLPDADQKAAGEKRRTDRQPETYSFLF